MQNHTESPGIRPCRCTQGTAGTSEAHGSKLSACAAHWKPQDRDPTRPGLEKRLLESQYKIFSHGARGGRSCAEKTSDHTWGYGGVATRSRSSKAAPHDEQEPSEDLPGIRVPKVNLIKTPKWPIKSPLKGVHRHQARAVARTKSIDTEAHRVLPVSKKQILAVESVGF